MTYGQEGELSRPFLRIRGSHHKSRERVLRAFPSGHSSGSIVFDSVLKKYPPGTALMFDHMHGAFPLLKHGAYAMSRPEAMIKSDCRAALAILITDSAF